MGSIPAPTRGENTMSKGFKNGTVVTADRAWNADLLYHAVMETTEIVE
jgi:hypothetical protein